MLRLRRLRYQPQRSLARLAGELQHVQHAAGARSGLLAEVVRCLHRPEVVAAAPSIRRIAWSPIALKISSNCRPCASACTTSAGRSPGRGLLRLGWSGSGWR